VDQHRQRQGLALSRSTWLNVVDAYVFVGPGSCFGSTTGGTLTTPAAVANVNVYANTWTGLINSSTTAPGTPVIQIATTNAGTATTPSRVSCRCRLGPIPRAALSRRCDLGLRAAADGGELDAGRGRGLGHAERHRRLREDRAPGAGASETPSTVAQARADAGTIVLTPAKAAFNAATTTTGIVRDAEDHAGAPFAYDDGSHDLLRQLHRPACDDVRVDAAGRGRDDPLLPSPDCKTNRSRPAPGVRYVNPAPRRDT
jgi:hypothetical protein